jgi:hypothetical protein
MPSMFESAMMLDALSGDGDGYCPKMMAEYRAKAFDNPKRWRWSIEEAERRKIATAAMEPPTARTGKE